MMRSISNFFKRGSGPHRPPPEPRTYDRESDPVLQAMLGMKASMRQEAQETNRAVQQIQAERARRGNIFSDAMSGNRDNRNGGS